ncbi:MAG TPA: glycosyltransferase, partial [Candidatus Omnitrophota bacterium]|nr:glycosyltransferase [Candidatus Omnitrophota bacterium]
MSREILLISHNFYPEIDATGQMMTDLAEDLTARGLKLRVITGRHQKGSPKQEFHKGIDIRRVRVLHLNKRILPFRFLNYISFFPSVFFSALLSSRPDAIFIVSSPPFMYFLGRMLQKLWRNRLVFNAQDLYPDVAVRLGLLKSRFMIRLLERLTLKMYDKATLIICIGDRMAQLLIGRGVQENKLRIIDNWSDGRQVHPIEKRSDHFVQKHGLQDKFIVQYSGNIGMVHEIDTVLSAALALADEPGIVFVFIGGGVNAGKIEGFVSAHGLKNVRMYPSQPRELLNDSLNAADVSLVTLKKGFAGTVVPSKIYGIMASGKPVIAVCPAESEASRIVRDNECGTVVDPGDVEGCVRAIREFNRDREELERSGKNARRAFMSKYDRPLMTRKYYEAIREMFGDDLAPVAEQAPEVSICLVNHNAREYTLNCIASIYQNTRKARFEVILADNASNDGTVAAVKE